MDFRSTKSHRQLLRLSKETPEKPAPFCLCTILRNTFRSHPLLHLLKSIWTSLLCLFCVCVCVYPHGFCCHNTNTRTKYNLGKKEFISSFRLQLIIEGSHGRSSGQELKQNPQRNTAHWLVLSGMSWADLLVQRRISGFKTVPPTEGWALQHQLDIKKMPLKTMFPTSRPTPTWDSLR